MTNGLRCSESAVGHLGSLDWREACTSSWCGPSGFTERIPQANICFSQNFPKSLPVKQEIRTWSKPMRESNPDFHGFWKTSPEDPASRVSKRKSARAFSRRNAALMQRDDSRDIKSTASSSPKSLVTTQPRSSSLENLQDSFLTSSAQVRTGLHISLPCACRVTH